MSTRFVVSAVVGVVVGYVSGSPQAGFQAFALTYGATGSLDPNQKVEGPRLDDLKGPKAAYGATIPYIEGTPRLAGTYIWNGDKRAIAKESTQDGKGGPGVDTTTYTYEIDCLIGLSINELDGIRRIWSTGKLVWSSADDADAQTLSASADTDSWRRITFYSGGSAQLPDPTYEAAVGVGNAPAYRGRATVFIEGLNLGGSGQLPILTFEVVSDGDVVTGNGFEEDFSEGLVDYTGTVDPAIYQIGGGPDGAALRVIGGPITSFSSVIERVATVTSFTQLSFKFRVDDLTLGSAPDDGPVLEIGTSGTPVMHFNSAREKFFDSGQTPHIGFAGSLVSIGAVVIDTWYDAVLRIVSPTLVEFEVSLGGTVISTVPFVGSFTTWSCNQIRFFDSFSFGGSDTKPSASYADIVIGNPGDQITVNDVMLDQVVRRLCLRTGLLTDDDIDVTELEEDIVRAMALSQVGSTRQAIEMLMAAYFFEAVEGEKIKFVKRGNAPALTIPYVDLGAGESDSVEPLPVQRNNDIEIPTRVTVKYANMANDFQDGVADGDRLVTDSTSVSVVELPLGFLPAEAKKIADANTMDLAVSIVGIGPVQLTRKYAALEPTDVVLVVDQNGSTYRVRFPKITDSRGVRVCELVLDDASAINSVAVTDEGYESSTIVRAAALTADELLDIPILRDADNDQGFYVVAKGAGTPWSGAVIYSSRDDTSYTRETSILEAAVFGPCSTTLGDWTLGRMRDTSNLLTVNLGAGTLSSSTWDAVLDDKTVNACAIGVDGRWEICQFVTAALVSPGVYILSGFLRGSRGTEWASIDHVAGESFVLLRPAGMRRILIDTSAIGAMRYYKAVSIGRNVASTGSEAFTDNAVGLKPLSPVAARITAVDPSTGDITLGWQRRTRLAVRTIGSMGISIPLGEEVEAYSIDIFSDNTYTTVLRTLTSNTPSVVYTAAMQTADSYTPGDPIYRRIYQLSSVVGRGYALEAA